MGTVPVTAWLGRLWALPHRDGWRGAMQLAERGCGGVAAPWEVTAAARMNSHELY